MARVPERSGEFKPYVPPEANVPEFTLKAIALGVFFGILFGIATVYLALRAGADRLGVHSDRGAGDRRLQEVRQVHDFGEQHRPDVGSAGGRSRRVCVYGASAGLLTAGRTTLNTSRSRSWQSWRAPGRALHDPVAAGAHRQGARQLPYPEGPRAPRSSWPGSAEATRRMVFAGLGGAVLYKRLRRASVSGGRPRPSRRSGSPSSRARR